MLPWNSSGSLKNGALHTRMPRAGFTGAGSRLVSLARDAEAGLLRVGILIIRVGAEQHGQRRPRAGLADVDAELPEVRGRDGPRGEGERDQALLAERLKDVDGSVH